MGNQSSSSGRKRVVTHNKEYDGNSGKHSPTASGNHDDIRLADTVYGARSENYYTKKRSLNAVDDSDDGLVRQVTNDEKGISRELPKGPLTLKGGISKGTRTTLAPSKMPPKNVKKHPRKKAAVLTSKTVSKQETISKSKNAEEMFQHKSDIRDTEPPDSGSKTSTKIKKQKTSAAHIVPQDEVSSFSEQIDKESAEGHATRLKCTICNKRMAREGCTQDACLQCCSDTNCEKHKKSKENALWREQVLSGTTDIQLMAKEKRTKAIRRGRFHEPGFKYQGDTIVIWNIYEYFRNPKWREDAVRKSIRRRRAKKPTSVGGKTPHKRKSLMEIMDDFHKIAKAKEDF